MADKLISELTDQALAADTFIEVESGVNVSGSATLTALKDFIETFIGGQVGSIFADITARDLAAATLKSQEFVEVTDASADPEINSGRAWYRFVTGTTFILLFSEESLRNNLTFACSDEVTDLTVSTSVTSFRIVGAKTITGVRASVNTAPTGAVLTVDINKNGTSILSTKLTIDATEKTSTTAAIPAVISTPSIADDDEITVDIDTIGSTIAGKGLKVSLLF